MSYDYCEILYMSIQQIGTLSSTRCYTISI